MLLNKNLIEGKTFTITDFSKKFRIAKNKSFVKSALEEIGGSVEKGGEKALIGKETINFHAHSSNDDYIFEGELEDRSYQKDFIYFKDYDLKLYDMLRALIGTTNIDFSFVYIGEPLTEDDFSKFEKKLKHPIPKAVKEFYSIFGELRILWRYRVPYERTGVSASKTVWNMDFYDSHIGSFQILPLKTVLFEKWDDEQTCLGVGPDLKVFDTSSNYYMVAMDIKNEGNPLVYRGEDHGVQFDEATPMLFTEYMDLCIGLYGKRERLEYFQMERFTSRKSKKELQDAIAGKIAVDINNDAHLKPLIEEITVKVDQAIAEKDYVLADKSLGQLYEYNNRLYVEYILDLERLKKDATTFTTRLKNYVKAKKVDWMAYEEKHKGDPIFESKAYLKIKGTF